MAYLVGANALCEPSKSRPAPTTPAAAGIGDRETRGNGTTPASLGEKVPGHFPWAPTGPHPRAYA